MSYASSSFYPGGLLYAVALSSPLFLGVSDAVSFKLDVHKNAFIVDMGYFVRKEFSDANSIVKAATFSAGFRLVIFMMNMDASFKSSFMASQQQPR